MNTAHQIEELRERGTFTITEHHDGHGLNDNIQVIASNGKRSTDPTGIPHAFEFHRFFSEEESRRGVDIHSTRGAQFTVAAEIQFQEGPRLDPNATPGVTTDAVIACLLAYLRPANVRFPSRETAMMITKLEQIGRLHKRIRDLEFRTEYRTDPVVRIECCFSKHGCKAVISGVASTIEHVAFNCGWKVKSTLERETGLYRFRAYCPPHAIGSERLEQLEAQVAAHEASKAAEVRNPHS